MEASTTSSQQQQSQPVATLSNIQQLHSVNHIAACVDQQRPLQPPLQAAWQRAGGSASVPTWQSEVVVAQCCDLLTRPALLLHMTGAVSGMLLEALIAPM